VLKEFFAQFSSLAFDDNSIEHYGEIRALLSKAGKPIGANDFLIAAIAKANQMTLVTN
jgi:tRNA(fMet)-specific endonuclease VapC